MSPHLTLDAIDAGAVAVITYALLVVAIVGVLIWARNRTKPTESRGDGKREGR